jgi:hypothetical protein
MCLCGRLRPLHWINVYPASSHARASKPQSQKIPLLLSPQPLHSLPAVRQGLHRLTCLILEPPCATMLPRSRQDGRCVEKLALPGFGGPTPRRMLRLARCCTPEGVHPSDEHAREPEKGNCPTYLARDVRTNPSIQTRHQHPVFSVDIFGPQVMRCAAQSMSFSRGFSFRLSLRYWPHKLKTSKSHGFATRLPIAC